MLRIHSLALLAVRILGIYMFLLGISRISNLLDVAMPAYLLALDVDVSTWKIVTIVGIPGLVLVIGGVLLWVLARRIANVMIPAEFHDHSYTLKDRELEQFVLAVVGLVLVIQAIAGLTASLLNIFTLTSDGIRVMDYYYSAMIKPAVQLIAGLLLVIKANAVAYMLAKIRNLGLAQRQEEDRK